MTETYRTTELANAKRELARARAAWHTAVMLRKVARARKADELTEFWANKVAFLSNPNLTK